MLRQQLLTGKCQIARATGKVSSTFVAMGLHRAYQQGDRGSSTGWNTGDMDDMGDGRWRWTMGECLRMLVQAYRRLAQQSGKGLRQELTGICNFLILVQVSISGGSLVHCMESLTSNCRPTGAAGLAAGLYQSMVLVENCFLREDDLLLLLL
jgi:hypothetical protein